jgi:hypothetical protein
VAKRRISSLMTSIRVVTRALVRIPLRKCSLQYRADLRQFKEFFIHHVTLANSAKTFMLQGNRIRPDPCSALRPNVRRHHSAGRLLFHSEARPD